MPYGTSAQHWSKVIERNTNWKKYTFIRNLVDIGHLPAAK